ncbi:hypothetical protein DSM3645_03748 [Blastopirellula marina DSM 3645]|uniref:Uncharacterized protein n=1 Tax=Blastopirellula marina DSM 3645 TaxID=314230 RepID=A3ZW61_9BACT|nr:hypothetical protein DSM3645_03748 [Blastopirellula marina DSM 3645]
MIDRDGAKSAGSILFGDDQHRPAIVFPFDIRD